jgi:hypothetical protein
VTDDTIDANADELAEGEPRRRLRLREAVRRHALIRLRRSFRVLGLFGALALI